MRLVVAFVESIQRAKKCSFQSVVKEKENEKVTIQEVKDEKTSEIEFNNEMKEVIEENLIENPNSKNQNHLEGGASNNDDISI